MTDVEEANKGAETGAFPTAAEGDSAAAAGTSTTRDYTEVTTQSYGSKLKEACSGVCVAFLLFFGSNALLVVNEGRTVRRARDLDEGRDNVLELDLSNFTTSIPSSFNDKLVHTVGDLSTEFVLSDPTFGVSSGGSSTSTNTSSSATSNSTNSTTSSATSTMNTNAGLLKLRRSVEMFQWVETSRDTTQSNADGSTTTTTTYSYNKQWLSMYVDSTAFKPQQDNINRTNPIFPFEPLSVTAEPILLQNRLVLTEAVVSYLNWFQPLNGVAVANVPDTTLQARLTAYNGNGFFYRSSSTSTSIASNPNVGDALITFEGVPSDTVSVVAKFNADSSLDGFVTKRGGNLLLVDQGRRTAEEMFTQAEAENTLIAWLLRFLGFFLMMISIQMFLQPIATAVDIVPFVGDCMQGGMEGCLFPLIGFIIALPISLFVIALSWLAYRPLIAIPICAVSLAFLIWLKLRHKHVSENNASNGGGGGGGGTSEAPMAIAQQPPPQQQFNNNFQNFGNNNNQNFNNYNSNAPAEPDVDTGGGGFSHALDNNGNPPATAPSFHP